MALDLRGICPLLQVYDMPTSLAFYRDRLGFEVIQSAPAEPHGSADNYGWVLLRHGITELMLNTAYDPDDIRPPTRDPVRVAAHDDTILFIGCPNVETAYTHLREQGLDVVPPKTTHYGMKQLNVTDPDGFGICFQWRVD
jgi:glyoxylase I family protein